MLLYNSQVSGNCYKVRLLLAHLGIAFERREVDVVDRAGVLRTSHVGETHEGSREAQEFERVLTAILEEKVPGPAGAARAGARNGG